MLSVWFFFDVSLMYLFCIFDLYGSQKLLSAYAELGESTGCRFLQSQSPYGCGGVHIHKFQLCWCQQKGTRMNWSITVFETLWTQRKYVYRFFWFPSFIRFLWIYFWDVYFCLTCDVIRYFSMSQMSHFHPLPRNMSRSMRCKRNWHNAMRSWKPCERTWQQHMPSWRMMMMFGREFLLRGFHKRGV